MEPNEFKKKVKKNTEKTKTQNAATTNTTSGNACLDYFFMGAAMRRADKQRIRNLVGSSYAENPDKTIKITFYIRDIRGGQGERRVFRIAIEKLAELDERIADLVEEIPEYGRWDDVFSLLDTQAEEQTWDVIAQQLVEDLETEKTSLLAKWMPSENASSDETQSLAYRCMDRFGISAREYRKMLSKLRQEIDVVERKMSNNEWDEINFEHVPSQALFKYRDAFQEHKPNQFAQFLKDVESGEADMNTQTLLPHQIVGKILDGERDDYLETAWEELPYRENIDENILVMADTSGSMEAYQSGFQPMDVSVGLALFFSELLKGPYADTFMSFSKTPKLHEPSGQNITQKVNSIRKTAWQQNTDFEAALKVLLHIATRHDVDPSEMVDKLLVISDMEFDAARGKTGFGRRQVTTDDSFMEKMRQDYKRHGYELPTLVFWNVDSKQDNVPIREDDDVEALLVSGYSPSIMQPLMETGEIDPELFMNYVVGQERYDRLV